ncbi:MAG TPA: magnesium-translocating P-type ATPase [Candidatus Sulfotelmatobacter sp.]|nr:magnesium-translocating P-type ATPase [Candidatus Sulfotelmatobacter sp.]
MPDAAHPNQPAGQGDGPGDGFWRTPVARLLADLGTAPAGLSADEAARRLARYGPNDATRVKRTPRWLQFLGRFANPLIAILLIASALSAVTGDVASFVIVSGIVLLSVVLDFVQETRAQATVDALRASVAVRARVRRAGAETEVPVEDLVPGDVVMLSAGDLVPADGRLIEARDFFVNQALLTGEAYPVEKSAADSDEPEMTQALNTGFAGTSAISGFGTMVVCRTGRDTALGGLAGTLAQRAPTTAFEHGLRQFGGLILRLTIFLVLFVLAVNALFQRPWLESLLFAVALAVGLTPELLPMIVTVTLARGAERLARKRVIVKRLSAIHNLGAIDVLCTDKTGTLTEARIRVIAHPDISGADRDRVFELAYLNAWFETGLKNPMDQAILDHGRDPGHDGPDGWTKLDEVPFDFERRRVSVLLGRDGERSLIVKGAPEDILRLSDRYEAPDGTVHALSDEMRARARALFEHASADGFRALAVAYRASADGSAKVSDEAELVFAGFVTFIDPPKASAGAAVAALAGAGVEVKILSGDNELVTRHVCRDLDIPVKGVMTGDELRQLGDEALLARLAGVSLFCRVNPQQKHRIILALKRTGRIVGFLGDGINDATALHAADVGISVDSGADVAKAAADMVLLDQDLSVVHDGVLEGRRTVINVSKYILMGGSSNFGNMFSMAGASLFLPFLPMLPIQVLLNNLLYDLSETGVPFDHVDPEAVARPVHWDIRLIQRFMIVMGPISSIFDFLTFFALLWLFNASETMFHTGWFVESVVTQVLVIFAIRTWRHMFASRPHPLLAGLSIGTAALALVLPLTPVAGILGFVAPPPAFYLFLLGAVGAYLVLVEVAKRAFVRHLAPAGKPARAAP